MENKSGILGPRDDNGLNRYEITVREISEVTYIVESHTGSEADSLFAVWADGHQDEIYNDLLKTGGGWEYLPAVETDSMLMDISYKELTEK